jgi:hypothetical protein
LPEVVWGWSKSLPDHVAFLGQARQGLFVLVQHLLAQRPSRVFVLPAYTCPSVTQAVEQAGGTCVFVDVDDALDFDWADLNEQLLALDLFIKRLEGAVCNVPKRQCLQASGEGAAGTPGQDPRSRQLSA